jgi:lysophospholipase L1-like esterase
MRIAAFLLILFLFNQVGQEPAPAETAAQRLERWKQSRASLYMNDFGELSRYRAANRLLPSPGAKQARVVFFGDSITDGWKIDEWFPGKLYVNRGISGQTTSQMLVRFRQDVIGLQPKAVVILAGTNDIAGNSGPIAAEDIEANLASMAELAQAHNIAVVLSSVTPAHDYTEAARDFFATRPPTKIVELNRWLRNYCSQHHFVYVDYFAAMTNPDGLLKHELADDGLHPNQAGYAVMSPLAQAAIEKALKGKQ